MPLKVVFWRQQSFSSRLWPELAMAMIDQICRWMGLDVGKPLTDYHTMKVEKREELLPYLANAACLSTDMKLLRK